MQPTTPPVTLYKINSISEIEKDIPAILETTKKGITVTIELTIIDPKNPGEKEIRTYKCVWKKETQEGKMTRDKTGVSGGTRLWEFLTRNPIANSSNATRFTNRVLARTEN